MRNRIIIMIALMMTIFFSSAAITVYANSIYKAPENIDTQEKFMEFRKKFKFNGDYKKTTEFYKVNQKVIQKLYPGLVDIGYTMYLEINTGLAFKSTEHNINGQKFKFISVPIRFNTYSKDNIPLGMELNTLNFALIPKNSKIKEPIGTLQFSDSFSYVDIPGNHQSIWVDNYQAYFVYINFFVPANQNENNLNIRITDGKSYVDLDVSK